MRAKDSPLRTDVSSWARDGSLHLGGEGAEERFSRLERMPELPDEIKARPKRKPGQEPTASLTLEAYNRLKAELEELMTVGRERIGERLRVAREHGDIRENAEYDAAKDAQGLMESQIRRLQEALRDPEIIEAPVAADKIVPHMLVTVRSVDDDKDEETYLLAEHGEEKAPGARTVTTSSPLGKVLVGASKDQRIVVRAPGGSFKYIVVGFEPFVG
jgi:transcription elongation factor GreA